MIAKKKKRDDLDEELDALGEDEEIIDFKEFEEFDDEVKKAKSVKIEDIEKNFIFQISNGCPICGGDVKGNDHYRYFCETCNVLFDKKDILDREFGKSIAETGPVRKTRLNDQEKAELDRKRKELSERIFKAFTQEEKKELVKEAEERKEELPEPEPEPEEESSVEEEHEPEQEPAEESDSEPTAEPESEKEEYELEDVGKIIASKESTKMHTGQCHFVKKIHPHNRIYLESVEQGQENGYEMCVCLRRMKAKQR